MFSQLTAKTATAPAVKTAPVKKNSAGKKVSPAKTTPAAVKTEIRFAVQDFARPRAGATLIAHTAAFLEMSGMADGKPMPKAQAAKIIGARAVQYHTGNGNFEQTDKGLMLTEKGEMFFMSRAADLELLAAFRAFFADGKVNPAINVKTEAARFAV